jgi:hypothetical protein
VGLIWGVQGGRGSLEQRVPWRRKSSGGEQRWWSRGAAEGSGKGVEGAHDVSAELGARGVRRGAAVTASTVAQLRQSGGGGRKGLLHRRCSFYSRWRRLAMAA